MNGTYSRKLMFVVLSIFALNTLSLFLYFLSSHLHLHLTSHHRPPPSDYALPSPSIFIENRSFLREKRRQQNLKPWPVLPSLLPWTLYPDLPHRSCEAYFGHGFTRRVDVLGGGAGSGTRSSRGWFRCFYSQTLRSSVCEGGNLRMLPDRLKMSRGGEKIGSVMGREEEEELPEFQNGAFEVLGTFNGMRSKFGNKMLVDENFLDEYVPEGDVMRHTMRQLIASIRIVDDHEFQCQEWIEEPALLLTRFEYANLFHTVTDWYSAYVASRVTNLTHRPHLVFVDGHCKAPLEETWETMFSSLRYARHFDGPVCFRHAILVPLGYETVLFKGLSEEVDCEGASALYLSQNNDPKRTARLSEFGEMIRASFGFPVDVHGVKKPPVGHNVLFVRREDYLAHPRHGGKVESRLTNEQEVFESLQKWAYNHLKCKINLVNGLFAHMHMKEQIRAIQEASVIIGAHGAGLTHIVSATPETVILEIISSFFRRPHFQLIAKWKGLKYHAIDLNGSYAEPDVVIDRFRKIMKSLGC